MGVRELQNDGDAPPRNTANSGWLFIDPAYLRPRFSTTFCAFYLRVPASAQFNHGPSALHI